MKKLLKILFWAIVIAATSFTFIACEKPENEPLQPETTETPQWWLKVDVPAMTYSAEMPAKAIGTNIGADGQKVGLCLDFADALFICRAFTFGDSVYQMTGVIQGKTFIVLNGKINVCGGVQNAEINYKIEYR